MTPRPGSSSQTGKGGRASAPPWTPPSSRPPGWLWGPFPSPACSLVTSFLSYVTSSLHGQGTSSPPQTSIFPSVYWDHGNKRAPGAPPCGLSTLHSAARSPCLLPQHLVLRPSPYFCFPPGCSPLPTPMRPCLQEFAECCQISPRFTPSFSRLVVRRVAPRDGGLVYMELTCLHIPDGMLGQ